MLRGAEREYDFIVVDTPPASVVPDAIPLVSQVGGVLVVSRLGRTTRGSMINLRDQLSNLDAPVLGVVVNAVGRDRSLSSRMRRFGPWIQWVASLVLGSLIHLAAGGEVGVWRTNRSDVAAVRRGRTGRLPGS